MDMEYYLPLIRLSAAALAGALIGVERRYYGRPAGIRTHTLVCLGSSLVMMLPVFFHEVLLEDSPLESISLDPSRMAQGVMTGIGFLGAGVIVKEGLTVRGLTTAAAIWLTAAIGIAFGMGIYVGGVIALVLALVTLTGLRVVEQHVSSEVYAKLIIRLRPDSAHTEEELTGIIKSHGVGWRNPSYHRDGAGFTYDMTVDTKDVANFTRLAGALSRMEDIEFSLSRSGVSQ